MRPARASKTRFLKKEMQISMRKINKTSKSVPPNIENQTLKSKPQLTAIAGVSITVADTNRIQAKSIGTEPEDSIGKFQTKEFLNSISQTIATK